MSDIWSRLWPDSLKQYQGSPKAIPMATGEVPGGCPNCGGFEVMMVYVIDGGPYKQPNGGKVKWLDLDVDPANPNRPSVSGWYSGKLEVGFCPVCKAGRLRQWITANCGLSGPDLDVSLAAFSTAGAYGEKAPALDAARLLAAMNREPSGFVTFHGAYGVGKTHLLKGLVNAFRGLDVVARYATMSDLLADIRERFGETSGARAVEEVIEAYRRARVLCVDEIDRVNLTGWAKETIFRLFDSRWNEAAGLLTVMATNLSPDELPAELGYLASRIRGGLVVPVRGPDVRVVQGYVARRQAEAEAA